MICFTFFWNYEIWWLDFSKHREHHLGNKKSSLHQFSTSHDLGSNLIMKLPKSHGWESQYEIHRGFSVVLLPLAIWHAAIAVLVSVSISFCHCTVLVCRSLFWASKILVNEITTTKLERTDIATVCVLNPSQVGDASLSGGSEILAKKHRSIRPTSGKQRSWHFPSHLNSTGVP